MHLAQHSVGMVSIPSTMLNSHLAHASFSPAFVPPSLPSSLRSPFLKGNSERMPLKLETPVARRLQHGATLRRHTQNSGLRASHMSGVLISKMMTSLTLMALGDMLTQFNSHKSSDGNVDIDAAVQSWDVERTARQGMFGAVLGAPICHFWFPVLEQLVPLTGEGFEMFSHVAERVMVDQLILGPINLILFLSWMSYLEDFSTSNAVQKCKDEMPTLYPKSLTTWVPVHMLTFSVVPDEYRVLWIGLVSILWSAVLSATASGDAPAAPAANPPRVKTWSRFVANFRRR